MGFCVVSFLINWQSIWSRHLTKIRSHVHHCWTIQVLSSWRRMGLEIIYCKLAIRVARIRIHSNLRVIGSVTRRRRSIGDNLVLSSGLKTRLMRKTFCKPTVGFLVVSFLVVFLAVFFVDLCFVPKHFPTFQSLISPAAMAKIQKRKKSTMRRILQFS